MIIRNNPVLGKFLSCHNLKLEGTNLSYIFKKDYQLICDIPLTDKMEEICDIVGVDFEVFNAMDKEQFFTWIATNQGFKYRSFINLKNKKSPCDSILLSEFFEWLDSFDQTSINKENFVKIDTFEISEFFEKDIERIIIEQTEFFENKYIVKKTINGINLLQTYPSFDKTKIGEFIEFTHKTDLYERYLLCKSTPVSEVIDIFVKKFISNETHV